MNKDQLASLRSQWEAHKRDCEACRRHLDGSTGTLRFLCWRGTQLYLDWHEGQAAMRPSRAASR